MDIDIILKVAGVGMIVAVICQILSRAGRDDQSTLVSITGIVIIFILIAKEIGVLIGELRSVFGI
jgi:stage III sporulation protein AC